MFALSKSLSTSRPYGPHHLQTRLSTIRQACPPRRQSTPRAACVGLNGSDARADSPRGPKNTSSIPVLMLPALRRGRIFRRQYFSNAVRRPRAASRRPTARWARQRGPERTLTTRSGVLKHTPGVNPGVVFERDFCRLGTNAPRPIADHQRGPTIKVLTHLSQSVTLFPIAFNCFDKEFALRVQPMKRSLRVTGSAEVGHAIL